MSDFMDVRDVERCMKPADLIEFDRGDYKHWGICIGNEEIVHISGTHNTVFGSVPDALDCSIDLLKLRSTKKAIVRRENLRSAAEGCKVRINNKDEIAEQKGLQRRDIEQIIEDSKKPVGQIIDYHIVTNNCEHFVTRLRYGIGWSDQACQVIDSLEKVKQGGMLLGAIGAVALVAVGISRLIRT